MSPGPVHALDNDESTVDLLRPGRAIHLRCPTQGLPSFPPPGGQRVGDPLSAGVLAKRLPGNIGDLS